MTPIPWFDLKDRSRWEQCPECPRLRFGRPSFRCKDPKYCRDWYRHLREEHEIRQTIRRAYEFIGEEVKW